jgi:hypothetical protein
MASKRHQRRNACVGKRRLTAVQAHYVVRHHPTQPVDHVRLLPYHCQFCGGWHVGHKVVREPTFVEGRRL